MKIDTNSKSTCGDIEVRCIIRAKTITFRGGGGGVGSKSRSTGDPRGSSLVSSHEGCVRCTLAIPSSQSRSPDLLGIR